MRAWLVLALAPLAAADQLGCAIDGAGATDSTVNAGVFLWAATERCAKKNKGYDVIKCEIDVTSAVKAISDMANTMVGAVNNCNKDINLKHAACGNAVGSLTSAIAGLGAGAGGLAHWLTKNKTGGHVVVDTTTTKVGKCVMNVKSVANGIFQAAAGVKRATAGCNKDNGEKCATSALEVVSILANMGSAIANSVDDCSAKGDSLADMSGDIVGLVAALDSVAQAGLAIDQQCDVPDARLYEEAMNTDSSSTPITTIAFAALIPIAVILGFVGGRRARANKERYSDVPSFPPFQPAEVECQLVECQSERE